MKVIVVVLTGVLVDVVLELVDVTVVLVDVKLVLVDVLVLLVVLVIVELELVKVELVFVVFVFFFGHCAHEDHDEQVTKKKLGMELISKLISLLRDDEQGKTWEPGAHVVAHLR